MLRYRLVTGALLIVAIVLICWGDDRLETVAAPSFIRAWFGVLHWPAGSLLFFLLVALVVPLAARELAALLRAQGVPARGWLIALGAALGAFSLWAPTAPPLVLEGPFALASVLAVGLAAAIVLLSRGERIEGVVAGAGGLLLGVVWLGVLPGFLLALRHEYSAWIVLGALLTTKACDIGAYFTGRAIGRHKLIPWLSPGKTWEGLVGGALAGGLAGFGLATLSQTLPASAGSIDPNWGFLCGVAFALVGQFGDLSESLLKRGAKAKDSGAVLPGMGGVLDVLDSALAVGPVAWWLL
jgi:phosphatidate cytidylyltransferase